MMFECGRRNAECGKKKRQRLSISDLGFFRFGISDLGFGIETAREGNRRYLQWLIEVIRFTG